MKIESKLAVLSAWVLVALPAMAASTALVGRDAHFLAVDATSADAVYLYDADHDITWLRAASTDMMNWAAAKAWAEQSRGGLTGWRLPTVVDKNSGRCGIALPLSYGGAECGYNPDSSKATGSEMAHLYYDLLGNRALFDTAGLGQSGWGLTNTGDFQGLQPSLYWMGVESPRSPNGAWYFQALNGYQGIIDQASWLYALAVRPGDVATAVPEPETFAMLLAGLVGVVVRRKRVS